MWGIEQRLTRQISEGAHSQTPPRVLSQRVQHVVEKADAGPYPDLLGRGSLAGMVLRLLVGDWRGEFAVVGEHVERAAVEGEGHLDFGFFGDALDKNFARCHCFSGDGGELGLGLRV
jgi:hypothetical protein